MVTTEELFEVARHNPGLDVRLETAEGRRAFCERPLEELLRIAQEWGKDPNNGLTHHSRELFMKLIT